MRGICGWIEGPSTRDESLEILSAMMETTGSCDLQDATLHLNHTSAVSARPGVVPARVFAKGALTVAVEGRIHWTASELRTSPRRQGDAAAVAEAYLRHGDDCLGQMAGAFAVAIIDTASASGLIAVDRMGIRSMCYANPQGQLVFGTTATSVSAHPKVGQRLSEQAIFNYLYCHVVPSPGTIFQSIQKLRPGECVSFTRGSVSRRFYWRLHYQDERAGVAAALRARFHTVLREAADRAIDGDVDIGAFLSGGTDSSTVAGLLTELRGRPAKTYSIGFAADGFDEMEYARITARHFGTERSRVLRHAAGRRRCHPGHRSIIRRAIRQRLGGSHLPVRQDGQGRRRQRHVGGRWRRRDLRRQRPLRQAEDLRGLRDGAGGDATRTDRAADIRRSRRRPFPPLRKLRSYIRQANVPLPDRLEAYNFLHRSPLGPFWSRVHGIGVDVEQPLTLLREAYQGADSASAINRMMHLDLKFTLADNDLRKVSKMCEAAGVEVRYPLIDDALVELSGEIPASLKVKGLQLRYFFKHALRDFLPAATIAKSKHGFGMPFGLWLREYKPLTDLAHESLDAFGRRGIVKPAYMSDLLRHHETGHATYFGIMIWVIMTLELWLSNRKL